MLTNTHMKGVKYEIYGAGNTCTVQSPKTSHSSRQRKDCYLSRGRPMEIKLWAIQAWQGHQQCNKHTNSESPVVHPYKLTQEISLSLCFRIIKQRSKNSRIPKATILGLHTGQALKSYVIKCNTLDLKYNVWPK